jgi:hypothetical protein
MLFDDALVRGQVPRCCSMLLSLRRDRNVDLLAVSVAF